MKNKKMSIRISEADWRQVHDKAEQAGMSLTEYVTACCLGKQIVIIDGISMIPSLILVAWELMRHIWLLG